MPAIKGKKRRGPAPLPEVEKTRQAVLRKRLALIGIEDLFESAVALLPGDEETERGQEVLKIAEKRLKLSAKLDVVADVVNAVQRRGEKVPKAEYEQAVAERDRLYAVLSYEVPQLGLTEAEWAEMGEDDRKKHIGRPKLSIERRLLRARKDYEDAYRAMRAAEDAAGEKRIRVEDIVEIKHYSQLGRPKMDGLDALDKMIRRKERLLEQALSPEAEQVYQDAIANPMGRKPVHPMEKAKKLRSEIRQHHRELKAMEMALKPADRADRQLKLARHAAYLLRREIREQGETPERLKLLARKEDAVATLLAKRDALREQARAAAPEKSAGAHYEGAGQIPESVLDGAPKPSNTTIGHLIRKMETRAVRTLN